MPMNVDTGEGRGNVCPRRLPYTRVSSSEALAAHYDNTILAWGYLCDVANVYVYLLPRPKRDSQRMVLSVKSARTFPV